jgi:hypothetical protein
MAARAATVTGMKIIKAVVWIVYAIATAAVIIIGFAFFLLIFNASTEAGFAEFIYNTGSRFAEPFAGMIEPVELSGGGVLSWSALIAMAAYAVLAALVGGILTAISRRIYRDTSARVVGQTTVTETRQTQGGTVSTATTRPVVEPSPVEQEEARRAAEAQRPVGSSDAPGGPTA